MTGTRHLNSVQQANVAKYWRHTKATTLEIARQVKRRRTSGDTVDAHVGGTGMTNIVRGPEHIERVRTLRDQGNTTATIARTIGWPIGSLYGFMYRHGIMAPCRPRREESNASRIDVSNAVYSERRQCPWCAVRSDVGCSHSGRF